MGEANFYYFTCLNRSHSERSGAGKRRGEKED